MKAYKINIRHTGSAFAAVFILFCSTCCFAQSTDSTTTIEATTPVKTKPVKNTFESIWIIDNQTVMVPIKKTFEMDIMHRFGTIKNGYEDFWGFFAPSNIRLGFSYVPINKLLVGVSITKSNMIWEGYAKYALLKQKKGIYPVSVTYYADMAVDSRKKDNFIHKSDRFAYFHQLMIARKFTNKLSVQIAPSVSHINIVNGYFKTSGTIADSTYKSEVAGEMEHNHFAVALSARYKLKRAMSLLTNIDQPLTKHATNNPSSGVSFGIEFTTSSHAFQLFFTNYYYITPYRNNMYNKNTVLNLNTWNGSKVENADGTTFTRPQGSFNNFLIGFNITRLWNY